jgi:hypothetical protein
MILQKTDIHSGKEYLREEIKMKKEYVSKNNLLANSFILGIDDKKYDNTSPRNYLTKSQINKLEEDTKDN